MKNFRDMTPEEDNEFTKGIALAIHRMLPKDLWYSVVLVPKYEEENGITTATRIVDAELPLLLEVEALRAIADMIENKVLESN